MGVAKKSQFELGTLNKYTSLYHSNKPCPTAHRMFNDHFKVGVFRPKIVLKINRGREKVNSLQGICATRERIVGFNLYYSIINCRVWACMRA